MQQELTRIGLEAANEDDQVHSGTSTRQRDDAFIVKYLRNVLGEDESVSFIDLQHNSLKMPEKKGILKKHDYGIIIGGEDAKSEDIVSQANVNMSQVMGGASMSEVERTLKSLNGYHEDILKALRNAASHRGTTTPSGSNTILNEEVLRRSLQECAAGYPEYKRSSSQDKICETQVS